MTLFEKVPKNKYVRAKLKTDNVILMWITYRICGSTTGIKLDCSIGENKYNAVVFYGSQSWMTQS